MRSQLRLKTRLKLRERPQLRLKLRIDAMKSVKSSDGTSSGGREDEKVEKSKFEWKRGDNKVF